jgi:hypothetical protein
MQGHHNLLSMSSSTPTNFDTKPAPAPNYPPDRAANECPGGPRVILHLDTLEQLKRDDAHGPTAYQGLGGWKGADYLSQDTY